MRTQGIKKRRKRKKTPAERTIIIQKIIIGLLVFISCCLAACIVVQQLSSSKNFSNINEQLRVALDNLDEAKKENTVLTYEMNSMKSLFRRGYSIENPEAMRPYLEEYYDETEYQAWFQNEYTEETNSEYFIETETTEPEEYLEYYGYPDE